MKPLKAPVRESFSKPKPEEPLAEEVKEEIDDCSSTIAVKMKPLKKDQNRI